MTSTALAPREQILSTVEKYSDEIAALAPKGTNAAHYLASLRLYFAQMPAILDCTPASVAQGVLRVAQTGLELGVTCYLLPFKNKCQFVTDYKGEIQLAIQSGTRSIQTGLVRDGDEFTFEYGTKQFLRHVPLMRSKAPITHAWAMAEVKPGSFVFVVLTREEIDEVRQKYSRSWKAQSLDDIGWYAKKTAVRRLSPLLPKNARFAAAVQFDTEAEETIEVETKPGEFTPLPTVAQLNEAPEADAEPF